MLSASWGSPIPTEIMLLVKRMIAQLKVIKYSGEYLSESFLENATSPPLATPFAIAIKAAKSAKTERENENTRYIPANARTADAIFTLLNFSPINTTPTIFMVKKKDTKYNSVAVPISMWLKA